MISMCFRITVCVLTRRTNMSVCLEHASALGKDTVQAVNNPQEKAMLVNACANCSVTIESTGIAGTGLRSDGNETEGMLFDSHRARQTVNRFVITIVCNIKDLDCKGYELYTRNVNLRWC